MKKRREVNKHIRVDSAKSGKPLDYDTFLKAAEYIVSSTDTEECPWKLIEANDKWFRDRSVARILIDESEKYLDSKSEESESLEVSGPEIEIGEKHKNILDTIDLNAALSEKEYDSQLEHYQRRIHELSWKAYDAQRSTVIVFEGWDASGKGGSIRRLTNAIDARLYRVISVMAPTDEELAHHYLWRFWRHVPRDGYMTLYDRSWYGRVLVERVENLATPAEWKRSYQEINNFEELVTNHGMVLVKFWLHIDKDVQLKRFRERDDIAWKRHKITDEDWRNRNKWDDYQHAVTDMIANTGTKKFPWTIVRANDKFYARIEVLKTVCKQLEKALEE